MSENRYQKAKNVLRDLSDREIAAIAEEAIVSILRDEEISRSLCNDYTLRNSEFDKGAALAYSLSADRGRDNFGFLNKLADSFRQRESLL